MKTPREPSDIPPEIPKRWHWHCRTLARLRDRLIAARRAALGAAAEPVERHSLHQADSATDEFDHELAVSRLSAEQDALYEVEAALQRIADGSYGGCEQTGRRISAARLKAVPWTRFGEDAAARLERTGAIPRPRLGTLASLREEPADALAESEPTVDQPEPAAPPEAEMSGER